MNPLRIPTWSELSDRQPTPALVEGIDLVIVRWDDKVSLLYGRCKHRGALMADGAIAPSATNLLTHYFECEAQSVLMSGYLGSIEFGFAGAMGAWAAAGHDRPIVSVSGDGGFGQYMSYFNTAVKYDMNITHILLNNSQLGKISKEQQAKEWEVWQTSLHNPDFSKYAKICGGFGIRSHKRLN